nr:ARID DNA-binding domain-containing protein [Tanacetum cinerariifolium]
MPRAKWEQVMDFAPMSASLVVGLMSFNSYAKAVLGNKSVGVSGNNDASNSREKPVGVSVSNKANEESSNEALMFISEDDCIDLDGMERSILAKVKDLSVITDLLKYMSSEGFVDVGLRYVGGRLVWLEFDSTCQVESVKNSKVLNELFLELKDVSYDFIPDERCVWIDLVGLPLASWAPEVYKKLGGRWGCNVVTDMVNDGPLSHGKAPNIESTKDKSMIDSLERKDDKGPSLEGGPEHEEPLDVDNCDSVSSKDDNNESDSSSDTSSISRLMREVDVRKVDSDHVDSFEEGEIIGDSVLNNDGCVKDCMKRNLDDDVEKNIEDCFKNVTEKYGVVNNNMSNNVEGEILEDHFDGDRRNDTIEDNVDVNPSTNVYLDVNQNTSILEVVEDLSSLDRSSDKAERLAHLNNGLDDLDISLHNRLLHQDKCLVRPVKAAVNDSSIVSPSTPQEGKEQPVFSGGNEQPVSSRRSSSSGSLEIGRNQSKSRSSVKHQRSVSNKRDTSKSHSPECSERRSKSKSRSVRKPLIWYTLVPYSFRRRSSLVSIKACVARSEHHIQVLSIMSGYIPYSIRGPRFHRLSPLGLDKNWHQSVTLGNLRREQQLAFIQRKLKRENQEKFGSHMRKISEECKNMLRNKMKEVIQHNTTLNQPTRNNRYKHYKCFQCKEFGHIVKYCPNDKKNVAKRRMEGIEATKPSVMITYPETIHFSTTCMIKDTNLTSWDEIWYVSNKIDRHVCYKLDAFCNIKEDFSVTNLENQKKFLFTYGIGEVLIEQGSNNLIVPGVYYAPEVTLNILSLELLEKQGLEQDTINIKGNLYTTKVQSFTDFVAFLNLVKLDDVVSQEWDYFRKRVNMNLGGYLSFHFSQEFDMVGEIIGLSKGKGEEIRKCYMNFLEILTSHFKTARAPRQGNMDTMLEPTRRDRECLGYHQGKIGEDGAQWRRPAVLKEKGIDIC